VRFGHDQVDAFSGVLARTMRDLGTPPHPLRFFRQVAASLGNDAWFGCVYLQNRPVAAGCAVRHGSGVELMWAGALRIPEAPNMLLHAAFIRRAAEEGLERFDFGRCTPGAGTHRFKLQWGAVDVPLTWGRSGGAERMPRQDSGVFAAAAWMWRRLPVPVTLMVGGRLRGGLPA
jgi:hypothetical protein